ncbi:hypothetical protein ACQZV8_12165 [Magnetococcales bacterium HHB-1]
MKEWLSLKEAAGLPGMAPTYSGMRARVQRGCFKNTQRVKGVGKDKIYIHVDQLLPDHAPATRILTILITLEQNFGLKPLQTAINFFNTKIERDDP